MSLGPRAFFVDAKLVSFASCRRKVGESLSPKDNVQHACCQRYWKGSDREHKDRKKENASSIGTLWVAPRGEKRERAYEEWQKSAAEQNGDEEVMCHHPPSYSRHKPDSDQCHDSSQQYQGSNTVTARDGAWM
jgi:hypothetical protein